MQWRPWLWEVKDDHKPAFTCVWQCPKHMFLMLLNDHSEQRDDLVLSVLCVMGPSWFTPLLRACVRKLKGVSITGPHKAVLSKQW